MTTYTGAQLYSLLTFLLGGEQIDEDSFYQLLDICRGNREMMRPWCVLKKVDTTQTMSPSDTFRTAKTLPEDFRRTLDQNTMQPYDPTAGTTGDVYDYYAEVPFEEQLNYKDANAFFIDYANNLFYVCGTCSKQLTIYFFYIADYGPITSSTSWLKFPGLFAPILAFDVAVMYKGGVDYDAINARMAEYNGMDAKKIEQAMEKWDNQLALSQRRGINYSDSTSRGYRSGAIDVYGNLDN
jgi:hypothetical protein